MPPRHPVPRIWLMTSERLGDAIWPILERMPRGAGVVFRYYETPPAERRRIYERVRRLTRARRLVLLLAGSAGQAAAWRADGAHGRSPHRARPRAPLRTAPAHDRREIVAATRAGADAIFLSPVFATRSHPGTTPLGPLRFGLLARGAVIPVIALGGMNRRRGARMAKSGAYGWAAIDAWRKPDHIKPKD